MNMPKVQKKCEPSLDAKQTGFTIIELLIATLVFSTILLILSSGLIQIGRQYYKGITTSRTQQVTRNVIDDISRNIQFSGDKTPITVHGAGTFYFCINNYRYTYKLNTKLVANSSNHVFVRDIYPACDAPANLADISSLSGASELLAANMRLANLVISPPSGSLYTVTIRVASGDDDLLDLSTPTAAKCKSQAGSQFCATAELQTTVQKRI